MSEFIVYVSIVVMGVLFGMSISVEKISDVESQKEFILNNATYKCTKTNELKSE